MIPPFVKLKFKKSFQMSKRERGERERPRACGLQIIYTAEIYCVVAKSSIQKNTSLKTKYPPFMLSKRTEMYSHFRSLPPT